MKLTHSAGPVVSIAAVAVLGLAGCSSSNDTTPSNSPTPTAAATSATAKPTSPSPTASPTKSPTKAPTQSPTKSPTTPSNAQRYALSSGGTVKIAGQGAGTYNTKGGQMTFTQSDGVLGGTIEVSAKGDAKTGDFNMKLVTNASGTVTSGSLTSPGSEFVVTGKGGKINFLTAGNGTTLVTVSAVPVQAGTGTPTKMTINLTGKKS
jgi:hypothetical protein